MSLLTCQEFLGGLTSVSFSSQLSENVIERMKDPSAPGGRSQQKSGSGGHGSLAGTSGTDVLPGIRNKGLGAIQLLLLLFIHI